MQAADPSARRRLLWLLAVAVGLGFAFIPPEGGFEATIQRWIESLMSGDPAEDRQRIIGLAYGSLALLTLFTLGAGGWIAVVGRETLVSGRFPPPSREARALERGGGFWWFREPRSWPVAPGCS